MSTKVNIAALAALIGMTIMVAPLRAETFDGRRAIIIDGDTIAIGSERVRILNIDAPESFRPRCEAELVAGLKAKERLSALLRAGFPVSAERHGQDRYGRTLARLNLSDAQVKGARGAPLNVAQDYNSNMGGAHNKTRDVGEILIAEGLALPWRPGPKAWEERRQHWCG